MRLQQLKRETFTTEHEIITHAINSVVVDGEYTICELNSVSSTLEYNRFESVEEPYEGKLKEVDCEECLTIINFIKNLQ